MANRDKSIELLNKAIAAELLATHQYMYFHFVCEDAGYKPLAQYFKKIAIREMIHTEEFAERILFLKGKVQMKWEDSVKQIDVPAEMLAEALRLETKTVNDYNSFARQCAEMEDAGTKDLFELILKEEEDHQDMFDTELEHFTKFGESYLALQSFEHSKELVTK